ncbi:AlbA family DNA-binding domain-containing protein [Lactobacillus acidophilus]|uniref:AlbA family DNA-binding domain-containing protein n=1 Tax=Lactobacillus acidophilus TaxID=1579 RepID=UPI001F0B68B4|nr:ATP-binding protein [Lactobacillus acidophilus]MDW8503084.1 ATP-binding protein [Lactobacillus acidophilus]
MKTVSTFANYGDGEIKFGIKDDGTVVGVKDPVQTCLNIQNKINDAIRPQVDYRLHIDEQTNVITLKVYQGLYPPIFLQRKSL